MIYKPMEPDGPRWGFLTALAVTVSKLTTTQ